MEYKGFRLGVELVEETGEFRYWVVRLEDSAEWLTAWTEMPSVEQYQAYIDANFS